MKKGILESVAAIISFSALIAVMNNYYMLIPMMCLVLLYMGLDL